MAEEKHVGCSTNKNSEKVQVGKKMLVELFVGRQMEKRYAIIIAPVKHLFILSCTKILSYFFRFRLRLMIHKSFVRG